MKANSPFGVKAGKAQGAAPTARDIQRPPMGGPEPQKQIISEVCSTSTVTVIDARMGRGKTSAAISYMEKNRRSKRFLYITPFLDEVDRICESCGFDQSEGESSTKSAELKRLLHQRKNIAATHSLFYHMDGDALSIAQDNHYTLIVDESLQAISRLQIASGDFKLVTQTLTTEDASGLLHWTDEKYEGQFSGYKEIADAGHLYRFAAGLIAIMNPGLLTAFDEVIMMTYLFEGQYQRAYLDYFGIDYNVVGVEQKNGEYCFADHPDTPDPIDLGHLIHIEDSKRMNQCGSGRTALSKQWFSARGYSHPDIKALRNNMRYFFQHIPDGGSETRMWTTFICSKEKLMEAKTHRFNSGFLQVNSRATNAFRSRTDVAYMANRFIDPNIRNFFKSRDITIDEDQYALSEMLQWIWRSAIRDGKEIHLYIPSKRMRTLLTDWIKATGEGGEPCG